MKQETEIKKIVLQVGGKEITLSVDDAKKLKGLLNELFGKDVIKEIRVEKEYHSRPYYYDWFKPYITCDSGTAKFAPSKHTLFCSVSDSKIPAFAPVIGSVGNGSPAGK